MGKFINEEEIINNLLSDKFTKVYRVHDTENPVDYSIRDLNDKNLCDIHFQEGNIDGGINGITNEDLIMIIINRLKTFQQGQYSCEENERVIGLLEECLYNLKERNDKVKAAKQGKGIVVSFRKVFPVDYLKEEIYNSCKTEIVSQGRWDTKFAMYFQDETDGKTYTTTFTRGSTEMQDTKIAFPDEFNGYVECKEVRKGYIKGYVEVGGGY